MSITLRRILLFALLLAVTGMVGPTRVDADPPRCTCREGNACYHFLNAPVSAPVDPCSCPLCRAAPGACPKKLPEGWDATCASNSRMDCFLRRHAASWKLSCSEMLEGPCSCKNPHPEWCPQCGSNGKPWDTGGLEIVKKQLEIEKQVLGQRRKFVIIKSPHFYLVTDIRSMKVPTQSGPPRVMGMHEIAHLYAQRAELAYEDFVRYIGRPNLQRPMAVYVMDKNGTAEDVQAAYLGSPRTNILYGGGGGGGRIAGGYPGNGFVCNEQKSGGDDGLHLQVRHSIGHILMSCWTTNDPSEKCLPKWVYVGVGHWLARLPERFQESATFCGDEGTPLSNSGKNWRKNVLKIAGGAKSAPVQRIFDINSLSSLDLDHHIRAWSWFLVYLEEDRERFVKFLAALRKGTEHRTALKDAFGCTPEEFDRRWKQRVLGKRATVAPTPEELDAGDTSRPGAKERASIRTEMDLPTLASKIRALQVINDPLTAATVVPILRTESELVRETIVLVLSKATSTAVKEWLRTEGLAGSKGVVRAYVARVLGNLGDKEAGPELMKYTDDGFWLTRAHVVRALGIIGHEPALPEIKERAKDKSQKVRIAAFDALGRFGEKAGSAWRPVGDQLSASAWQVRSAAAECLGNLGQMASVEPLITRMEIESGRIRQDIRTALKQITRDDLGNNPEHWRNWWEKEKERANGGLPERGAKPKEPPKGEMKYGNEPTYYGLQVFSQGIGYVLDVSSSMLSTIKIDPTWIKKQRRTYPAAASKFDLAKNEIAESLSTLRPQVRFNVYFFRKDCFTWKKSLVPATASNTDSAISRLGAERPTSSGGSSGAYQTNYVDVFRLVLDVRAGNDVVGNFGDTPDEIYFLTDGTPTTGDITDSDVLASWFRELNRFARVKVNVITFGNLGVDPVFLRRLAEENNGVFVQVPEVR